MYFTCNYYIIICNHTRNDKLEIDMYFYNYEIKYK